MTEKYTINLAEVAVSLGALQSSSMTVKDLSIPMTPPGERDLPPNPACHLTSVSESAPGGGAGIGLSVLEIAKDGRKKTRGVDREGLL